MNPWWVKSAGGTLVYESLVGYICRRDSGL